MRVAIVSGPRGAQPMGLESAERALLEALREVPDAPQIDLRVVGGRAARAHARAMGGRWYPSRPGRLPARTERATDLVHLSGLDLPPPRRPFVVTVHDLAPLRFDDEGVLPPWSAELATRAERVITPSRATADELEELLGVRAESITVIPIGPGHATSGTVAPLNGDELAALGIRAPFVLRMGGYTQRKNVSRLLEAWPEVRRRTGATLALAGPSQPARAAALAAAPSLDGVVPLGYLPSGVVPRLLRAATVLVSTSLYEGFGLPPLEAMAAGVPVVAVRSASVQEVCGDAALLVADDAAELARGIARVVADAALGSRLVASGRARSAAFGWPGAAEALVDVYREVTPAPGRRRERTAR